MLQKLTHEIKRYQKINDKLNYSDCKFCNSCPLSDLVNFLVTICKSYKNAKDCDNNKDYDDNDFVL